MNLPSRPRRTSGAGFTLVEMLVAMALLALVVGLASLSGDQLQNLQARHDERGERIARLATGLGLLRSRLHDAVHVDFGEAGAYRVGFTGEPESLSFVTAARGLEPVDGLLAWRIALVDAPRRFARRTRVALSFVELPPGSRNFERFEDARRRTLLMLDGEARLEYFGRSGVEDEPRWHDSWQDEVRLPQAVRLVGDGRLPVLVMPVAATMPSLCAGGAPLETAGCASS